MSTALPMNASSPQNPTAPQAMSQNISHPLSRPKGTQDITPEDVSSWQWVEATAQTLLTRAGYREIRTPIFEYTELFHRGVGDTTDIVNKEMYSFEKGDRSLTLRPEGTASVVRSYIEQGMSRLPKPVKLYYAGPMFRYERPQAGRQRQFHQLGLEVFGLKSPALDAEVIQLAVTLLQSLGIQSLTLEINNIGDTTAREAFRKDLRQALTPVLSELCSTCQTRFNTNVFRLLDCKSETCQAHYHSPAITALLTQEWASTESQNHFNEVLRLLDALNIPYQRNVRLVRGLDYYTDTVFEITSNHLGAQNAVCGGGGYDTLVQQLGGPETPGIGWAMGLERLIQLMPKPEPPTVDYYWVTDQWQVVLPLAQQLRERGHTVIVDFSGKGFGKQFAAADKAGAKTVLITGSTEAETATVQIKDLKSGEQHTETLEALLLKQPDQENGPL